jgi:hypothetical protein
VGSTLNYDVTLTYILKFNKRGLYRSSGTYSYYSDIDQAQVTGTFISEENSWYWERSSMQKWAISFMNFPVIAADAIAETGLPIRFEGVQTFDVLRLSCEELQLDYQTDENSVVTQVFEPYTIADTVQNCQKTLMTTYDFEADANWFFKKIIEETP